ncbi:uncharacterized protein KY384_000556 [Bacidia gigantensis]|uniref:uncharacterized protein n=1 Tax=Bacidia gigantensis TaxID=2732470 RepID=UPI001D04FE26|nr:uncharacterized protein KY384_000556 [Bacidia gigantensis]KAG8525796.1 hypothetical protein KY384_000556 [Bacidia gigantensis]
MSWIDRHASNHNVQLAAVALISGIAVAGTIFSVQAIRRKERIDELKASIPELSEDHKADLLNEFGAPSTHTPSQPQQIPSYIPPLISTNTAQEDAQSARLSSLALSGSYDPTLIDEQLTRTSSFLGPDRFARLRKSFIVVVGLGGVGSHCVSALARSGVSKIRLVDFDQVTLSSLNRHAVATLSDVGTPKVDCVKKQLRGVVPWVDWECWNEVWKVERAGVLLGASAEGRDAGKQPDYVVDAIDNIDSKVALLKYCHENGIKVVSSMGAGCKSDPTKISVGDISASVEDPLSRVTRRRLRAVGVAEGIPVVYSIEKPGPGKAQLLPLPEEEFQKGSVNELSVLPDFRARILPVLGTMPAVFGYAVANFLVMEITGYPHDMAAGKAREKMYDAILSNLQGREEQMARFEGQDPLGLRLPVTKEDVGYLVEEVYKGKSVVSGLPTRLTLVRWRRPDSGFKIMEEFEGQKITELELNELVCMTKEEACRHAKKVLKDRKSVEEVYNVNIVNMVKQRQEEDKVYHRYR